MSEQHPKALQDSQLAGEVNPQSKLAFASLFDIRLIQKFQDAFSLAAGVGSVIVTPQGELLTQPSNFTDYCQESIDADGHVCVHMQRLPSPGETIDIVCPATGLLRCSVAIHVGKKLIGIWIIGQVREKGAPNPLLHDGNAPLSPEDEKITKIWEQTASLSRKEFAKKAEALSSIAEQLSEMAEQTMRQRAVLRAKQTMERQLKEREATLDGIVSAAPIGIGLVENRILGWTNQRLQDLLGRTEEELLGQSARILYPDEDEYERVGRVKHPMIKIHGRGSVETRMITKNGSLLDVILSSSKLTNDVGETRFIFTVLDITESKLAAQALSDSRSRFREMFTNMQQGVILLRPRQEKPDFIITDVNPAALRLLSKNRDKLLFRPLQWAIPAAGKYGVLHALKRVEKTGQPVHLPECFYKDGRRQGWRDYSIYMLTTGELVVQFEDITESVISDRQVKASLKEKETLLKEIHHRVKNNLQIISSLLRLQVGGLKHPQDAELFIESQNRIRSMALVHEKLYGSNDLSSINFTEYIQTIASHLLTSYSVPNEKIHISTPKEEFLLSVDQAVPLGLLLNELLTNAFKHAFPGHSSGNVEVQIKPHSDGYAHFSVSDDGQGLPPNIRGENYCCAPTLGLQLVTTLAEQLNAEMHIQSPPGTSITLLFPLLS
ncbi:MAG: histidine kinase dimerization/phosphoacceptor domain -containing protein [Desulfovibrio sp.]|uniref:histidine kinase dimerization/phosphoacceptor domain -containing protein n=1 Tax=Desulfovibrio sp. 7SRBS1 TaxID=3378064 RepID=UPI003B3D8824